MRLHHLAMTAFGPFAGTEEVDFDELDDAGLFLVTGPTGAGKTSILDAVTFALYGTVPGVRGIKTLKSHHAPVDARPEVVLEVTLQDRRLRVRRSPAWTRPKLRGSGTIEEPASATLVEVLPDGEHFLSSRAQEVGHQIGSMVGMSAEQFCQVALLPQGGFATFLRAGSQERHDVLQHLFRTDRFARIETWVHDHSRDLQASSTEAERAVQRVVDQIADRSGEDPPVGADGDLGQAAADGRLTAWAADLARLACDRSTAAARRHADDRSALEAHRAAHEQARQRDHQARRRRAAEAALEALAEGAEAAAEAEDTLARHLRATGCLPLVETVDELAAARAEAGVARDERCAVVAEALGIAPGDVTTGFLSAQARARRTTLDRIETLLPREQERREARDRLVATEAEATTLRARTAEAAARRERLPAERDAARAALTEAVAAAHQRGAVRAELDAVRDRLEAVRRLPRCETELQRAEDDRRRATDRAQEARDRLQDLVGRRLAQAAADLAGRLTEGAPCPVCGSSEHPAPATPADDAVTERDQDAAAKAERTAAEERDRATAAAVEAAKELEATRRATGGLDERTAASRERELVEQLGVATVAQDRLPGLEARVAAVEDELEEVTGGLHADESALAAATQAAATARELVDRITAQLAGALPEAQPDRSLAELRREEQALLDAVEDARAACERYDHAEHAVAEHTGRAAAAAKEAGFEGLDDVRRSVLDDARQSALRTRLDERVQARTRAEAVLEEVGDLDDAREDVDLPALEAAVAHAERELDDAGRELHEAAALARSLTAGAARLEECVAAWAPVRAEAARAASMAKLVRGIGGDNHRQVRLSAYVLAARLDQVVDAANERLSQMRDQRYLLERTDRLGRKGSQAGLALDVVDQWTGDVRDPATLSGGETFVVSLALALGLADVVTQEAGGTEIETLFVDEGFGSLDADTLDDVMDRIDDLRDGGRTVGIVSHVTELRDRILTQLTVEKSRTGSNVSVQTLAG